MKNNRSKDYSSSVSLDDFKMLKNLNGPILITGHTGFKGTWLTFLLQQLGIDVCGVSLPAEKDSMYDRLQLKGTINEEFIDLRDQSETLRVITNLNPCAIIHLAAQPLVLESYAFPIETFSTNVMGTAHLLDAACKTKSVKVIGVATTDKVYLNENRGEAFKENSPLGGKDPYSASKVGTEQAVRAWQQMSAINDGPKIVSMRAGNVIGGGDFAKNRLLPDLIRAINSNEKVQIRNPSSTRPWQHVLEPLYGYLLFMESALRGSEISALNFSPLEKSLSVHEVVEIFQKRFKGVEIEELENMNSSQESIYLDLDSSLASSALGWKPKLTQAQAVNLTIDWWEANAANPSSADPTLAEIDRYLSNL
jgi:CDP-glucose 4,6-dehydratase